MVSPGHRFREGDSSPETRRFRSAIASIDAKSGQPQGPPQLLGPAEQRMPALAVGGESGLVAVPLGVAGRKTSLCLYRIDKTGQVIGVPQEISAATRNFVPLISLAFDGQNYLLTSDRPSIRNGKIDQIRVWGWQLPPAGQPLPANSLKDNTFEKDGFVISTTNDKDQIQGFACAGRKGSVLVAYVEVRGPDKLKIMARIVTFK